MIYSEGLFTKYFRDWLLITGRGGYKTGGEGSFEVLPLKKKGFFFFFAMLKGGAQNVLG